MWARGLPRWDGLVGTDSEWGRGLAAAQGQALNNDNTHHIQGLQSLRGIAALVVLLHHSLRIPSDAENAWFVSEYLLNAHAAVVLFFVLSGYVLSLSLLKRNFTIEDVARFYVRRGFRIYPALWLGVLIGAGYFLAFRDFPRAGFSVWAGGLYAPDQISAVTAIKSFLGVGTELLPPLWTIKNELVASVLLPFMVIAMRQWWRAVLLVSMLAVVSFLATTSVPLYLVQFALGAVCAIYAVKVQEKIRFNEPVFWVAVIVLVFFRVVGDWKYHDPLPSLVEGLAAVIVVMSVVSGGARFLSQRFLVYLGDRSYGLYLFHLPIALGVGVVLEGAAPMSGEMAAWSIALATLACTLLVSHLSFDYVEKPCIAMGRNISGKVGNVFRIFSRANMPR